MKISINGETKSIDKTLSIKEMLDKFDYSKNLGAVALNAAFVSIKDYETTMIKDGDSIDILSPVQGG
ncbi:MAG TPA: sulfur carrier protein ThiS [Sulfurovum sp.]|nr:sulfur carrier protein ThiS [Sulfurovum sp.]